MKLVSSHVLTVDGVGQVLENDMMYNDKMDAIPYGLCTTHLLFGFNNQTNFFFSYFFPFIILT